MVTKIGLHFLHPTSIQGVSLPKVTKIALGALALLILSVAAVAAYRTSRTYKPVPIDQFPEPIIDLFGGKEKFQRYPFISYPRTVLTAPSNQEEQHNWILKNTKDMKRPITVGIDQWGSPFVVLFLTQISNNQQKACILQCYKNTWYYPTQKFFNEDGSLSSNHVISDLIKNSQAGDYRLAT